jgi:hypothetical protein
MLFHVSILDSFQDSSIIMQGNIGKNSIIKILFQ